VQDLATDAAHKAKGFADGNQSENLDYTYDANGNMTRDLNKGIGTNTTDARNVIVYNHLNLPQTVSKGGSTIRYVYDATGRKLAQYVTSGASQKRTGLCRRVCL
jgi:YD repeat-containing protein